MISDKEQLRKLVAVLKNWWESLLGKDGEARIELAERLAAELTDLHPAKRVPEGERPDCAFNDLVTEASSATSRTAARSSDMPICDRYS